jgi:hypothetical protein
VPGVSNCYYTFLVLSAPWSRFAGRGLQSVQGVADPDDWLRQGESYVCAINEVYECVTVTGCSRISLEDANVAGIMVLDLEKKQLSAAWWRASCGRH